MLNNREKNRKTILASHILLIVKENKYQKT